MRWLFFIFLSPALLFAGTTTVTLTDTAFIHDVDMRNIDVEDPTEDTLGYGAFKLMRLRNNAAGVFDNLAIWRTEMDSIYPPGAVIADTLYIYVEDVYTSGTIKVHRRLKQPYEGTEGIDSDAPQVAEKFWYDPSSNWDNYQQPAMKLYTGSLPNYFNWVDSNVVSPVKDQADCGDCWAHSITATAEGVWAKDIATGTRVRNAEDSSGIDRAGTPETQATDDVTIWVNIPDQWYQARIGKFYANKCDTLSYAVTRFAEDTGDIQINIKDDTIGMKVCYTNDNGDDHIDTLWKGIDDVVVTCLSAVDTDLGMGGSDYAYINDELPIMLIRASDIQSDLWFADTMTGFRILHKSGAHYTGPLLFVDAITAEADLGIFYVFKPWETDDFDSVTADTGATYIYWDAKNYKNWGADGCNSNLDFLDLSEQQLVSCAPDSNGCDGFSRFNTLQYLLTHPLITEEDGPWQNDDEADCPSGDSAFGISWFWQVFHANASGYGAVSATQIERVKRALVAHGPLSVSIRNNTAFASHNGPECFCDSSSMEYGHAGTIVGWDDTITCGSDNGAWIFKNSWGEDWGDDGYAKVKYSVLSAKDVYALCYSPDSSGVRWSSGGGACFVSLIDTCLGENSSNITNCVDTTCDVHGDVLASIVVDTPGWLAIPLDTDLLDDRRDGAASQWGYHLRPFTAGMNITITATEAASNRPYFVSAIEIPARYGQGNYGQGKYGR